MGSSDDLQKKELIEALEATYPIRDKLQKTLIETYNEELLTKVVELNHIIEDAENVLKIISQKVIHN